MTWTPARSRLFTARNIPIGNTHIGAPVDGHIAAAILSAQPVREERLVLKGAEEGGAVSPADAARTGQAQHLSRNIVRPDPALRALWLVAWTIAEKSSVSSTVIARVGHHRRFARTSAICGKIKTSARPINAMRT